MDEPVFPDKTQRPSDADLAQALGRTKAHWDNLRDHALAAEPAATPEWKFYTKKSGWSFVVRGKKRNLLYLGVGRKRFTAGFLYSEKAARAAEEADLPDEVLAMVRDAPRYPEGRGIRLDVKKSADVKIVKKLFAIRMAN